MTVYFLQDKWGDDIEISFSKEYLEWRKDTLEGIGGTERWGLRITSYTKEDDDKKIAHVSAVLKTPIDEILRYTHQSREERLRG